MIITIDIGNSNTVIVGYKDNKRVLEARIDTYKKDVIKNYTIKLKEIIKEIPEDIIVSCVVPMIKDQFIETIELLFQKKPIMIDATSIDGLTIKLDNPNDIGADFIATSWGAIQKYQTPVIIADVGSATKLTVVDETGSFLGGAIIPGIGTSMRAFAEYIPHLPEVALEFPKTVIGSGTIDAIQSGALYGLVSQIEGLAMRMEKELGTSCTKIITGGYASIIHGATEAFIYDEFLLNDGLYEIYQKGAFKR